MRNTPQQPESRNSIREQQMKQFEVCFREAIQNFKNEQKAADPNWLPNGWRVKQIRLADSSRISFTSDGKTNSFQLLAVPENLTDDEGLKLRQLMNKVCAEEGFISRNVRAKSLSSEVIQGVKKGDEAAWSQFAEKHRPTWLKQAERAKLPSTILEPDDLVSEAMTRALMLLKNGDERNPDLIIRHELHHIIYRIQQYRQLPQGSSSSPQSNEGYVNHENRRRRARVFCGSNELITKEQIDRLIKAAEQALTAPQQEILKVLLANHEQQIKSGAGYYVPSETEIGNRMDPPIKRGMVTHYIGGREKGNEAIAKKLEKAAQSLVEEDPSMQHVADYVVSLIRSRTRVYRGREV